MNVDMPKMSTPEEQAEREAIFENMLDVIAGGLVMIKGGFKEVKETVELYQNNKELGISQEDQDQVKYAGEFKSKIGYDIEDFLGYLERRKTEEAQKRRLKQ